MRKSLIATIAILAAAAVSAPAIVIRADIPDERYREFGAKFKDTMVTFPWVGKKGEVVPAAGTGTLIDPRWILTVAHVADRFKKDPTSYREHSYATINGKNYPIEQVYFHPDSDKKLTRPGADVALIKLAKQVEGGKPACLYPAQDEIGRVATIAGFGSTGTHLTGPGKSDFILRAATTQMEAREVPSGSLDERPGETLATTLRHPSDPGVTPLEGSAAPGDSGGPAFLQHDGKLCVAGLVERSGNPPPMQNGAAPVPGAAHDADRMKGVFVRVSAIRGWAMDVMAGKVAP